jgi:hypothetical protein
LLHASLGLRIAILWGREETRTAPRRIYMNILDTCFVKEKELVNRDVAGERIVLWSSSAS